LLKKIPTSNYDFLARLKKTCSTPNLSALGKTDPIARKYTRVPIGQSEDGCTWGRIRVRTGLSNIHERNKV
jgi:hypothetical protein